MTIRLRGSRWGCIGHREATSGTMRRCAPMSLVGLEITNLQCRLQAGPVRAGALFRERIGLRRRRSMRLAARFFHLALWERCANPR
jgi:hypothetical protein